MNPSVNRSSESPHPLDKSSPKESVRTTESKTIITKPIPSTSQSAQDEELRAEIQRKQPIPEPSHPRQYRAIGLIEGQYQRSEDQLTRGNILTPDGMVIDAVILGRIMSLVKKHIDLEESHLWVVYPRTGQDNDQLHVQIVGVWEPETLSQDEEETLTDPQEQPLVEHGYFSIRGEVIFASNERQTVIIKIKQSAKKEQERAKFFKLKLTGTLPDRPVSHFWDLQVQLQGDSLVIKEGTDLGFIKSKRPFNNRNKPFNPRGQRRSSPNPRRIDRGTPQPQSNQATEKKIISKPSKIIKKKTD